MKRTLHFSLPILLLAALLVGGDLFAALGRGGGGMKGGGGKAGGGGGGAGNGGRNNNKDNNDNEKGSDFKWYTSVSEATSSARGADGPVLAVLRRPGNPDDTKMIDKMASWPVAVELSQESMAALKLSADSPEGKALIKSLKLKTVPSLAWLDQYGNGIFGQGMPDSVQPISGAVQGWKNTLASIEKFFKEHQARGDKFLGQGRLREAYIEFSIAAPFKGPLPEAAKVGQDKVKERWTQLLDVAAGLPAESRGREAIVKGLRRDTQGLDFAAILELAIAKGGNAQVAAGDKPAAAGEEKSLSEVLNTRVSTSDRDEEASLDFKCLSGKDDERYKQAELLLKDGMAEYKKATAESMERGAARNTLLKSAHTKFDKTLLLLDAASAGKPDGQIEKLMEKTSMLMYGSLKYQSL